MQNFPFWQRIGFLIIIGVLIAGGVWIYKDQEQTQQRHIQDNLYSVAKLKAHQTAQWRRERLADGSVLMESIFLAGNVPGWMTNQQPEVTREIVIRLSSFRNHYKYDSILFVNPQGAIMVSTENASLKLHPDAVAAISIASKQRKPVLLDLHRDFETSSPHMTTVAPLLTGTGKNSKLIGAFILISAADQFLFPLIQTWPVPSRTAETLLVQRDGNDVLFLNNLRHRRDTALKLRIPLTRKEVPAVAAIEGRTGIFEGKDYRGEKVISALLPVPDSAWFIVAKMDKSEAYAAWRFRSMMILALLAGMIILTLIAGMLFWQRREKSLYRSQYLMEAKLRTVEKRHSTVLHSIGDAVIATDAEGRVELLNPVAEALTGWTNETARGKPLPDIFHIVCEETGVVVENSVRKVLDHGHIVGLANHTLLIARDGTSRPIDDSAAPVRDQNGRLTGVVLVFRDRTESKKTQDALIKANERLELAQTAAGIGVWDWDQKTRVSQWTGEIYHLLGLDPKLRKPSVKSWLSAVHPDDRQTALDNINKALENHSTLISEYRIIWPSGEIHWINSTGKVIYEEGKHLRMLGICVDVTQRKRAEEQIFLSVRKWQSTFDSIQDPVALLDENCLIMQCNQAFVALLDRDVLEIIGRPCFGLMHKAETNIEQCPFVRSKKSLVREAMDFKIGDRIYNVIADPIIDRNNQFTGAVHILQDITVRKQMEEALRESEEKYRVLFDASAQGILVADVETRKFIFANKSICNMLGYSNDELLSLGVNDIHPKNDLERIVREFEAQAGGLKSLVPELPCLRKDRSVFYADVTTTPTVIQGAHCLLGLFMDVTERKQANEKLREAFQTADDIIQKIPSGLYIYQYSKPDRLHLIGGNSEAQRLTGLQLESMKGREFNETFPKAAEAGITDHFLNVIRTGQTYETEGMSYKDERFSGIYRIRAFALPGERLAIAFEDMAEKQKSEQEKERLQAQLNQAQKMESVGRLAGGVAHDFNNMLGIILGHAELALSKVGDNESLFSDLTAINKAARRSADLTRQLLAFARKQIIVPRVLDLNDTVAGMLKMLRRLIGEEIDLAWTPGANLPPVRVDPGQIDQILANLCINARDAIVSTGKITIETQNIYFTEEFCRDHAGYQPGDYVLLAVSDNGCGMDETTLGHLFEPFFTTKEIGRGTGLGLATVYGIVKQNSGFIHVHSEAGTGTTFKIYLPHCAGAMPGKEEHPPAEKAQRGEGIVLLVEDERTLLHMCKLMMERLGYVVLAAATPGEALKIVDQHSGNIDLLITDVIMPGMNGNQLAAMIAERAPKIKQLFMSGYTADVIAHHGVLNEGIEFIQKPFSMHELSKRIKDVLAK